MNAASLMGIGTALVYPTLLATVSEVAHPDWRASAVGVYRLWRDSGYAVGALAAGLLADAFSLPLAIAAIAALTLASGVVVAAGRDPTLPGLGGPAVSEAAAVPAGAPPPPPGGGRPTVPRERRPPSGPPASRRL